MRLQPHVHEGLMAPMRDLAWFSSAALLMAMTPGPNMTCLAMGSISRGRKAGVIALAGVISGAGQ